MPPQQRLGSYQKGSPTCPWEQAAECREDRPICRSIPHAPVELAFENTNPMSEHHDLNVFVRLASLTRHNKAEDATQADVEQGEGHGGSWPDGDAHCQSRGLIVVLVPFIRFLGPSGPAAGTSAHPLIHTQPLRNTVEWLDRSGGGRPRHRGNLWCCDRELSELPDPRVTDADSTTDNDLQLRGSQ
jgi:hypothetical protein